MSEGSASAWRIDKWIRASEAFTGVGAALEGGRWNPSGIKMVYTSENLAMAAIEKLVHLVRPTKSMVRFVAIPVWFDFSLVETLSRIPPDWDRIPVPDSTQRIGAEWVREQRSAILSVSSAIIPLERNFLLNPMHSDFQNIRIGEPMPFSFDPRLTASG